MICPLFCAINSGSIAAIESKITLNDTGKIAAQYAEKVLETDREMIERTIAFERNRRTIILGSCAFLPANELIPIIQEHFCKMAITLPSNHFLAAKKAISFHDLNGISILAHGGSGFWLEICKEHLSDAKLLVQDSIDTLSEIVDASSLPGKYSKIFNAICADNFKKIRNNDAAIH